MRFFAGIFIIEKGASSYGHFTEAKEFWSQCHIFRCVNNRRCQRYAKEFANVCRGKPIKKIINSRKYPKQIYEWEMNTVY